MKRAIVKISEEKSEVSASQPISGLLINNSKDVSFLGDQNSAISKKPSLKKSKNTLHICVGGWCWCMYGCEE